ncbi:MAG: thioredoxin domain-containing protein [Planctomycetes bacterium]|nr:thioredoxin domain-containing protein [Planctomycetota bacterium]
MTNHLAGQTSPYLLQHQHNPVEWYPWGPEALERARREDRPIFLSIGYSACHWCHVMERESFEDQETARFLNAGFVSIKVDREERPDLDEIYMHAVQTMTGHGGWPLSVFLLPDLKPFYGGTYFPPSPRYGMPSFRQVLAAVAEHYRARRGEAAEAAEEMARVLAGLGRVAAGRNGAGGGGEPGPALIEGAARQLEAAYDPVEGGFGGAPKFPHPMDLSLLLRWWRHSGEPGARAMVERTLDKMAAGGIHDQVGGGFHRYSVDGEWLVPHFEKMLYDQALLARTYAEAFQAFGSARHRETCARTLDFVIREMQDEAGGYYSSLDADSEGVEGKFYVWSRDEILAALGPDEGERACAFFGVTTAGNFEGSNILHVADGAGASRPASRDALAAAPGPGESMGDARARLLAARSVRVRPGLDDKMLAAWNGLMIRGMCAGHQATREPRYRDSARRAGEFLWREMWRQERLARSHRRGASRLNGYLEDYAFVADAFVDLYEATFDPAWIERALAVAGVMIDLFSDEASGAFFFTARDHEALIARSLNAADSATPGGNSIAALALLRLGRLADRDDLWKRGARVLSAFSGHMARFPAGAAQMLQALDFMLEPPVEIAVAGAPGAPETEALLRVVGETFLPNRILGLADPGVAAPAPTLPLLRDKRPVAGRPAAFLCENFVCRAPETDPARFREALRRRAESPARR